MKIILLIAGILCLLLSAFGVDFAHCHLLPLGCALSFAHFLPIP